jgi:hypothetical protein
MSSGTCQNFCGSARRKRAGSIVVKGQAGIVDENVHAAKSRHRDCDDTVAIGGPAQIRDERQDLPVRPGGCRLRLDPRDIGVDVADGEDMVSRPGEAERHGAAQPAQPAGDDCDTLFHEGSRQLITRRTPKGKDATA